MHNALKVVWKVVIALDGLAYLLVLWTRGPAAQGLGDLVLFEEAEERERCYPAIRK